MKNIIASVTKGCTGGADRDYAIHIANIPYAERADLAPLARWHEEIWANITGINKKGRIPLHHLGILWSMVDPPQKWKDSRGPIGATHLTVKRLGWKWGAPFTFTNDLDQELHLQQISPSPNAHA